MVFGTLVKQTYQIWKVSAPALCFSMHIQAGVEGHGTEPVGETQRWPDFKVGGNMPRWRANTKRRHHVRCLARKSRVEGPILWRRSKIKSKEK